MSKICLECFNCKKIPLESKYIKSGIDRLLRCSKGHFDFCEADNLTEFEIEKGYICRDFDGELEITRVSHPKDDSVRVGTKKGYVNLSDVLPPSILESVQKYVQGPKMVYLPSIKSVGDTSSRDRLHNEIEYAFKKAGSIRGAAKMLNCSRNTVRNVIREIRHGLRDQDSTNM